MKIYDVSLTISQSLPVWPGDPAISLERVQKIEAGASANVTLMNMSVHVGTHVDAPFHFLGGNSMTVEMLSLQLLTGRAHVLRIPNEVDLITADVLLKAGIPTRTRRLIFRTRNSDYWSSDAPGFQTNFVALSADGAQFIVERGIRLVGIDYLSIAPYADGKPTHQILLSAGVGIIEGLNLSEVSPGRYTLYCLPLKIAGSDGAPARVILVGV